MLAHVKVQKSGGDRDRKSTYMKRLFQFWGALPLLLAITVTVHRIHSTLYLVEHNCLVWISSLLCFLIYGMHHLVLLQSQVVVNFTEPLGLAAGFVHKVNVRSDVLPVQYQKLCRLPFAVRDAVSQALKRLESEGIIEKGDSSPWVSPLVVIQKKYGGQSPSATHWGCFTELHGASMFSSIDLQNAYHQVTLCLCSRALTFFVTHDILYCFTWVPYGLASARSTFQRSRSQIFASQDGMQCHLDGIIVYGDNSELHEERLQSAIQ